MTLHETIAYFPYQMHAATTLNAKSRRRTFHGALLRSSSGYACLHPWPELGDLSLDDQLEALARGESTALLKAAMACLKCDGRARVEGVSLFEGLAVPPSHATIPLPELSLIEKAQAQGFQRAKVKLAKESAGEMIPLLEGSPIPLRIDFNETGDPDEIIEFLKKLSQKAREKLEFIEDLCAYHPDTWNAVRAATGVPLALDRQAQRCGEGGFDILVIKPAIDAMDRVKTFLRETAVPFVVTSYMDHLFGQLFAAYHAALLKKDFAGRCLSAGLVTHTLFDQTDSPCDLSSGPVLQVPEGSGLGLDDYLASLSWKIL